MTNIASDVTNNTMMELLSEIMSMRFKGQFPNNIEEDGELRAAAEMCVTDTLPWEALQRKVSDMMMRSNVVPAAQVCSVQHLPLP